MERSWIEEGQTSCQGKRIARSLRRLNLDTLHFDEAVAFVHGFAISILAFVSFSDISPAITPLVLT